MFETPEQLQRLVDRAAAAQRQQEQIQRAVNAGDQDAAWFLGLPDQMQATLYAREAIADAVDAARVGDVAGVQQGIRRAVDKAIYEGAQLGRRERRPVPKRRVHR